MLVDAPPNITVSMAALDRLVAIARAAGQKSMAYYGLDGAARLKCDGSPVTEADAVAHDHIVAELSAWDPSVPIVSEEGVIPTWDERKAWARLWLVDPLDGTKEFIKGLDEFTVNIALIYGSEPVLGVVYAPALDLVYFAGRGLGAFRQRGEAPAERITSRPARPGEPVVVVESRSHPSPALEEFLSGLTIAYREQLGSSLKICRLAEGSADVYGRFGPTMEWDVAAADCVFRQSGADRPRRSPLRYNQPDLRNRGFVLGFDDAPPCPPRVHPTVVWLTGLSGAGKSTIAERVALVLRTGGHRVETLDGDAIRAYFPNTGFAREDREAHVRRVGYMASRLAHHGVVVLVSLISPYAASRAFVRSLCPRFVEVHVATSLEACERRDVKGLYARARRGEITHFTGIDDPYEAPERAELVLDTNRMTVDDAAAQIVAQLEGR